MNINPTSFESLSDDFEVIESHCGQDDSLTVAELEKNEAIHCDSIGSVQLNTFDSPQPDRTLEANQPCVRAPDFGSFKSDEQLKHLLNSLKDVTSLAQQTYETYCMSSLGTNKTPEASLNPSTALSTLPSSDNVGSEEVLSLTKQLEEKEQLISHLQAKYEASQTKIDDLVQCLSGCDELIKKLFYLQKENERITKMHTELLELREKDAINDDVEKSNLRKLQEQNELLNIQYHFANVAAKKNGVLIEKLQGQVTDLQLRLDEAKKISEASGQRHSELLKEVESLKTMLAQKEIDLNEKSAQLLEMEDAIESIHRSHGPSAEMDHTALLIRLHDFVKYAKNLEDEVKNLRRLQEDATNEVETCKVIISLLQEEQINNLQNSPPEQNQVPITELSSMSVRLNTTMNQFEN